jgi:hypothetical protein
MASRENLSQAVLSRLKRHGFTVSAAGIRYGSVAYVCFGQGVVEKHSGRADTTRYPCELEFGSDVWRLIREGQILLDSENFDQEIARIIISKSLVGSRILDIKVHKNESIVVFEKDTLLISEISSEPASGFLYGFQAENEPAWETVDGVLLQT